MSDFQQYDFQQYRRKQIAELRPYVIGEDLAGVSISAPDRETGSPKEGDMIARNPKNHADKWLVSAQYFADNFEPLIVAEASPAARGVTEALRNIVKAWEATKPGETTRSEIQRWLIEDMKPAIDEARAALQQPVESAGDWRLIETAPKDGTEIDVWCSSSHPGDNGGYRIANAYWSRAEHKWLKRGQGDCRTWMHQPTHWMPLPSAPATGGEG
jgi:hypothetical protein